MNRDRRRSHAATDLLPGLARDLNLPLDDESSDIVARLAVILVPCDEPCLIEEVRPMTVRALQDAHDELDGTKSG